MGLVQVFIGTGFVTTGVQNRIVGTFAHPNAFAFALLIGIAAAAILWFMAKPGRERLLWSLLGGFYFILLILTYTRSTWIAAFIIGVVWLLNYQRKLILPLALLAVLVVFIFPIISATLERSYNIDLNENPVVQRLQPESEEEEGSLYWRWRTWGETLPAVWLQPFFGYGPGNFPYVRMNYVTYETDLRALEAHNDYLRLAIETGLIGLLAYLMVYISLLKNFIRHRTVVSKPLVVGMVALLTAILIASFSDNVLRNAPMQWMLWSLAGMASGYLINKHELSDKHNN
jgi:O-antigen ligase